MIVENPLDTPIAVKISVSAPDGWIMTPLAPAHIGARNGRNYLRVQIAAPAEPRQDWQEFTVTVESEGKTIATIPLRAQVRRGIFTV